MFSSCVARAEGDGEPVDELITLSKKERVDIRVAREKADLTQRQLATKVGVTSATISNVETGRHPQIRRSLYAELQRVLFRTSASPTTPGSDIAYRSLVEKLVDMDEQKLNTIAVVAEALKKTT